MDFEAFLTALRDSPIATAIREGSSLFPWIESFHVLALVTVVGAISIVDLRLMGFPAHMSSVKRLTSNLLPITWLAFTLAVITGVLLFMSSPFKYWENLQFKVKLVLLVLAGLNMLLFHVFTWKSVHLWDDGRPTPTGAKIAGATSLSLWIAIVFFGRWIGFTAV
jgi:hypothetical protein